MSRDSSKVCLTIAGLDPSGGAGIVADVKTFSAFGCFAAAVVTSLTFQNTVGVFGAVHQTAETVRRQIEPVFADLDVAAVKTGMLPTEEIIRLTAELLRINGVKQLVVDPVVRSTSGFDLIGDSALSALVAELFPLSSLVTPNIHEAERIAEMPIRNDEDITKAGAIIQQRGARNVLIKGGHYDSEKLATDHLFTDRGIEVFHADRINTTATHGTGCTLSSAIAANLALGRDMKSAVDIGKVFVTKAIRNAMDIGHGHSPVNQLIDTK